MIIKKITQILVLLTMVIVLSGCTTLMNTKMNSKKFKHNTPLIKGDIKAQGKAEVAKTIELGPKPVIGDTKKLQKRKKISSEIITNYLTISNDYPLLKQQVTLKYKNVGF